jgi:hypothetical protein
VPSDVDARPATSSQETISFGLSHQEAPQEDAEAQAQEDAEEDQVAASRQVIRPWRDNQANLG